MTTAVHQFVKFSTVKLFDPLILAELWDNDCIGGRLIVRSFRLRYSKINTAAVNVVFYNGFSDSITKTNGKAIITPCIRQSKTKAGEMENYNPITNPYATLWKDYYYTERSSELIDIALHILEYYFLNLSGEESKTLEEIILNDNRDLFITTTPDGQQDLSTLNSIRAILQYTAPRMYCEFSYDEISEEQIRTAFKTIFYKLGQSQHYEMMIHSCTK